MNTVHTVTANRNAAHRGMRRPTVGTPVAGTPTTAVFMENPVK